MIDIAAGHHENYGNYKIGKQNVKKNCTGMYATKAIDVTLHVPTANPEFPRGGHQPERGCTNLLFGQKLPKTA